MGGALLLLGACASEPVATPAPAPAPLPAAEAPRSQLKTPTASPAAPPAAPPAVDAGVTARPAPTGYLPGYSPPGAADSYEAQKKVLKPGDTCGASVLQDLVGKPKTEIPVTPDLSRRRVICTACPLDGTTRTDRQTILFDATTGIVTSVTCG